MVGQGVETLLLEPSGHALHAFAGQAIDNAGIPNMLSTQKPQQLLPRVPFLRDAVLDIRAVEAADEMAGAPQREALDDLGASAGGGGRGEGNAGYLGKVLLEQVELQVIGPEIVPPLRDAMGLVNGEQRNGHLLQQSESAFLR